MQREEIKYKKGDNNLDTYRQDLSRRDLEPYIGTRARVSEILNRSRGLTLPMIRRLHEGLKIPAGVLIRESSGQHRSGRERA